MENRCFIILMLLLKFYACSAQQSEILYPAKEWDHISDKEMKEWNASKLSKLRKYIIASSNTTGMLVIYNGKILFEYGNISDNSYIASCRKSILSMLYGAFVEKKKILLDKTLKELGMDDIGGLLPIEKMATIRDLLTARSGVYHPASNPGDATAMAPARGSVEPGSFFLYNNWDFNVAGYILEKETGLNIYDITDSILTKPLMFQDWNRSIQHKTGDSTLSKYMAYHLWFSTRDMARIGYLMLRKGQWREKTILSSDWVKLITTPVTSYEETVSNHTNYFDFSYGYLWWIWDNHVKNKFYKGGYTASGAFGQFITVLPALDLVIAHKTNYDDYGRNTPTETYLRIVEKLFRAKTN
ncbi:MAG: serine hydrolase [Chitinophagaceae bacterium]